AKADNVLRSKATVDAVSLVIFWPVSVGRHCDHSLLITSAAGSHYSRGTLPSVRAAILSLRPCAVFYWASISWIYHGHHTRVADRRRVNDQPGHHWHLYRSNLPGS